MKPTPEHEQNNTGASPKPPKRGLAKTIIIVASVYLLAIALCFALAGVYHNIQYGKLRQTEKALVAKLADKYSGIKSVAFNGFAHNGLVSSDGRYFATVNRGLDITFTTHNKIGENVGEPLIMFGSDTIIGQDEEGIMSGSDSYQEDDLRWKKIQSLRASKYGMNPGKTTSTVKITSSTNLSYGCDFIEPICLLND